MIVLYVVYIETYFLIRFPKLLTTEGNCQNAEKQGTGGNRHLFFQVHKTLTLGGSKICKCQIKLLLSTA